MYTAQNMYEQSHLGNNPKPWESLNSAQRAPWERWAEGANNSTFEGLVDNNYSHDFQALINVGYRLATNMVLLVKYDQLPSDWGGPDMPQYQNGLMAISLDAPFHPFHQEETTDTAFVFNASFDKIYRVTIPYDCIAQILFPHPNPPEPRKVA